MRKFIGYLKEFIFEQKCMPWWAYKEWYALRNLVFNINTQKHWDHVWGKEKVSPRPDRLYPIAFGRIIAMVSEGSRVVDVGCGIGVLLGRLKDEKKCEVFGVDISKEAISVLRNKKIDGIVAKIPPIPLPSNSFDVAIATELLEHVTNSKTVLSEMLRILKPGGFLIVSVPDNALAPHSGEREHVRAFTQDKIRKLISKNKKVSEINIFIVPDESNKFFRIIATARKCQISK